MTLLRKVALFFKRVPSSIRAIIDKVYPVTTELLKFLESEGVEALVRFTPTTWDDTLLMALQGALKTVNKSLSNKRIAGQIAKSMIASIDKNKMPEDLYDKLFERVYEEKKAAMA